MRYFCRRERLSSSLSKAGWGWSECLMLLASSIAIEYYTQRLVFFFRGGGVESSGIWELHRASVKGLLKHV